MSILHWFSARLSDLLGWFGLSGYTLHIGLALVAALLWWYTSTKDWLNHSKLVGLSGLAGFGALLSGRTGFVLENYLYFQQNPSHIVALHTVGGLHGSVALIGATLALLIGSKVVKAPSRQVIDSAIPAILLIAVGAWRACTLAGCASGQTIIGAEGWIRLFVTEGRDLYSAVAPRLAVQNIAAFGGIIGFILSIVMRKQAMLWMALYASGCVSLTLLRGDAVPMWNSTRSDTITWSVAALLYLILAIILRPSKIDQSLHPTSSSVKTV